MNITEFIQDHTLLLDGGMGTLLQAAGLPLGEHPERWNLSHPDLVRGIHQGYFDAGSRVVSTNTFGINRLKFSPEEMWELVQAAVSLAKEARKASTAPGEKYIALDLGPTGKLLRPYGDLDFEEAVELYSEVVRLGASCGVDLILIETMNDSYETKAAVLAAKECCSLPVFVSNAYGADGKLMTGADPGAMVAMLEGLGVDAIGVNCSLGPKQLLPVVEQYLAYSSLPVLVKPNAGLPTVRDGETVYDLTPEDFAETLSEMVRLGVRAVGGCCGTTPDYIRALSSAVAGIKPLPLSRKARSVVSSYTHAVEFGMRPIVIGERINPTGKKKFKAALLSADMDTVLREGLREADAGADVLDVNVGLPELDEAAMLVSAVTGLQAVLDLPLQIDSADPGAMEAALRRYNGKAMINSVNGKRESMEAVFPLVKKYGGLVVALTLDEGGIPADAAGRVAIAERILSVAQEYGIEKKDLIFDPLCMTVSADPRAAIETLSAVERIGRELGCLTSLGISNVSFGLPGREILNGSFLTSALERGLSAAIVNPYADGIREALCTYCALHGLDENFKDYIAFAESCPTVTAVPTSGESASAPARGTGSDLQDAILAGMGEAAARATEVLLESAAPLDIVQSEIIPALDRVGKGFEEKTVYLPQLLMSAEAARAAFERIRLAVEARKETSSPVRCRVVLATVKGDIHDIGKNIVKLLLENYGFAVTDLGKDVPPECVVEAVVREHVPLVGLSALMTTTVPSMEETIKCLRREAPWCRIVVGGAVLTREYADRIGADHYAEDAMATVRYGLSIDN